MRLFIEPVEPLLFRTGRPFDAGQDSFAESLFPPTPETLQGAVRATIATYWDSHKNIAAAFNDPKLTNLIGDRTGYGRFRITGLALGRYHKTNTQTVERLLPPPAHIMKVENQLLRVLPKPLPDTLKTNFPTDISYYLAPERKLKPEEELKPLEGWLTETDLYMTLGTENLVDIKLTKKEDIYQEESRLGIGIQRGTKATEEGYLYQTLLIRMNHDMNQDYMYGFVVDINLALHSPQAPPLGDEQIRQELHLPTSGWMILGGEQRAAYFRILSTPEVQTTKQERKRSLLYLATPAMFDTGWKPSSRLAPLDKPLTAAIHRYEAIGGWKLNPGDAKGENKVSRRSVPAGSVYFYDNQVGILPPLTDYDMEIGYGISYEGEW